MASINIQKQTAKEIDQQKISIEAAAIPKLKSIFSNMANDAEALYLTTGNIPAVELSDNYELEFTKEIRDIYRKTIKRFGFSLRGDVEKKYHLFFDAEFKKCFIDLDTKESIEINDPNLDPKLEQINNEFLAASTLFIANMSQDRSKLISNTNSKEIQRAVQKEQINYAQSIDDQRQTVNRLAAEGNQRQIDSATRQLNESIANERAVVAKNIKDNLMNRRQNRADLIAEQEVGLSESWARQTEAELVDKANLATQTGVVIGVEKSWETILDSKTRTSHAMADGQVVNVNQSFLVGSEELRYPRDSNGSAGNVINCRCVSSFTV